MKYIMIRTGDETASMCPIIFPEWMVHAQVADAILKIFSKGSVVISAGFCNPAEQGWNCWGKSESMKLESHIEDSSILTIGEAARFMWSRE